MDRTLWLGEISRSRNQLAMSYGFGSLNFQTVYWYGDVDLLALEATYGREAMDRIYFHILVIEATKAVSLKPERIDLGPYSRFHTKELEALWTTLVHHIWAQWRYENQLPHYEGPAFPPVPEPAGGPGAIQRPVEEASPILLLCGGGKDSLVSMKLLERAELAYSSLAYACSVYGASRHQHQLIDGLLDHGSPQVRHKQWISDSLIDAPIAELHPELEIQGITAAETPASIFGLLPIALQHGYRSVAVGHEHSANEGNLVWEATGEEVNHQWGKSFAAEQIIGSYLRDHLLADLSYFSLLQPIYDVVIFNLLRRDTSAALATHSCNLQKPWCGRCPKCAYVGLGYLAYLPLDVPETLFNYNLLDFEDNLLFYRQMLGLESHTPFECIGQIGETRLAFELCKARGLSGRAMDVYQQAFPTLDVDPILEKYLGVDRQTGALPREVAGRILPQLSAGADEAKAFIYRLLQKA